MANGVTYGGVSLPLVTADVLRTFDARGLDEVNHTYRNGWPNSTLAAASLGAQPRSVRITPGMLFDPAGARPAVAKFIGTKATIDAIRDELDTVDGSGGGSGSGSGTGGYAGRLLPLEIATGDQTFSRDMRMLPPRPLAGVSDYGAIFLLTFVDSRYDWQETLATSTGTAFADWRTYLAAMDARHAVYSDDSTLNGRVNALADLALRPAKGMADGARWPAAIEAAALAIGARYAFGTGLVDHAWSAAKIEENYANFRRVSGGSYPWIDDDFAFTDDAWLLDVLPQTLQVAFKLNSTREWVEFETHVGGNAPSRLLTAGAVCPCVQQVGSGGSGSGAVAARGGPMPSDSGTDTPMPPAFPAGSGGSSGGSGSGEPTCGGGGLPAVNDAAAIQRWVDRLGERLREWMQLGWTDAKGVGVVPWTPDGVHDVEYVFREGECHTRVYRQPWHDGVELVQVSACDDTTGRKRVELVTNVCLVQGDGSGASGSGRA